jgi:hypothetical protein
VGDIDFKVISAAENSNKFQKTRFWKEKSVEDMVTLGPTAQATLVILNPQKQFTLKQLDASQQNQTWSSTHSVMPWMLLDALGCSFTSILYGHCRYTLPSCV